MASSDKLRTRVDDFVGPDEQFVAAAVAEKGPTTTTLAIVSLLLSPIVMLLMLIFARRTYVVLVTDHEARLYGSSNLTQTRPMKLVARKSPNGSGDKEVRFDGNTYRVPGKWVRALPKSGATGAPSPGAPTPNPAHDETLKNNRNRILVNWAMIPLCLAAIVGIGVAGYKYLNPANDFSVAAQADATYCSGDNYGNYMAAETVNGTALIIGDAPDPLAQFMPNVERQSRGSTQFGELINNRGSLKADFVVCVSPRSEASERCGSIWIDPAGLQGQAVVIDEGLRLERVTVSSEGVQCKDDESAIAQFDSFLCETVGCRVGV